MNCIKGLVCIVLVALTSACSVVPETLVVNDEANLADFERTQQNPLLNKGKQARWGGIIASTKVLKNTTEVEVVNFPLSSSAKPRQSKMSTGRFKLIYVGLLDPVIFKQGRSITAVGQVSDSLQGKIGEQDYQYPVINASYVHMWRDIQQVDVRVMHTNPYWYYPHYRHYYPRYYYPVRVQSSTNSPSGSSQSSGATATPSKSPQYRPSTQKPTKLDR